ncbi:MAG TPA: hypothetical protein VNH40_10020 [Gaiellaceae bacterium]|nr:hypothetical protein [Gaiellaceae bacterium]
MSAVTDKLATLRGWQLALALAVLGLVSYFVVSFVIWLLSTMQPFVSIAAALAAVGWGWLVVQRARRWQQVDWRARSVLERR